MRRESSNLAYKIPLYQPSVPKVQKKIKTKQGIPPAEKLLYLGSVIFCVLISFFVLSRYCLVTELSVNILQTERAITMLSKENHFLKIEKRNMESVDSVRKFAESKGLELTSAEVLPLPR